MLPGIFLKVLDLGPLPQTPGFIAWSQSRAAPQRNGVPRKPTLRLGLGPWIGAQVASQRGPILRPGPWQDNRFWKR